MQANAIKAMAKAISIGVERKKPCCDKLKKSLQNTALSNPNHKETHEENMIIDNVEFDIEDNCIVLCDNKLMEDSEKKLNDFIEDTRNYKER